ncbi:hypothetical protein TCAL_04612 [Tigriopus californicus]|uniref:Uncharacterized protein n=1 Tax=Tigriopus californicus TaxID=6832 RepID=A0A553PA95_TIGCA|nr:uncharacterized protein LOC131876795 [Tigriopus californicus]TRY74615.1 hypothetical protein TCAL_04612 [Tigriopus californicus]|eukprot:TCALIF_04612-PA protein Name:"Protein of unknown function" AED:0.32 eAED:0.32 QI:0/1/0.5/1/1/1/2/206/846
MEETGKPTTNFIMAACNGTDKVTLWKNVEPEMVVKLRQILKQRPMNIGAIRLKLRAQGIGIKKTRLRPIIKTHFPEFEVGTNNGVVTKTNSQLKAMVGHILIQKSPISLSEMRKQLCSQGTEIRIPDLRSVVDTHFPKYVISHGVVNPTRTQTFQVFAKPPETREMRMVQAMLKSKCPIHVAEVIGRMEKQGVGISKTKLRRELRAHLPEFTIIKTFIVRTQIRSQVMTQVKETEKGNENLKKLESILKKSCPINLSKIREQLRATGISMSNLNLRSTIEKNLPDFKTTDNDIVMSVKADKINALQNILNKSCPINMGQVRAELKRQGIQTNNKDLRATLAGDLPEFQIGDGGMIFRFDDACRKALESIANRGCALGVHDILTELSAKGIRMSEANLRYVAKGCFLLDLNVKADSEGTDLCENDTLASNENQNLSDVEKTSSELNNNNDESINDTPSSNPKDHLRLIQSILDEKCPISVTEVRMTLISYSIALSRGMITHLIVMETSDYFIVEGLVYLPTSISCEGGFMANVVLGALHPILENKCPQSLDNLVAALAIKGIEISENNLERIITEFSFKYKCHDGFMCSLKKIPKETMDPKSLEEIVMCLKSLDVDKSNSLKHANQKCLFKRRFLEDVLGNNDVYNLLKTLIVTEDGIGFVNPPKRQLSQIQVLEENSQLSHLKKLSHPEPKKKPSHWKELKDLLESKTQSSPIQKPHPKPQTQASLFQDTKKPSSLTSALESNDPDYDKIETTKENFESAFSPYLLNIDVGKCNRKLLRRGQFMDEALDTSQNEACFSESEAYTKCIEGLSRMKLSDNPSSTQNNPIGNRPNSEPQPRRLEECFIS